MMTVYDLEIGQKATIHSISGDIRLAKRLFALGCISGTEISVKKVAPFGDPMVCLLYTSSQSLFINN